MENYDGNPMGPSNPILFVIFFLLNILLFIVLMTGVVAFFNALMQDASLSMITSKLVPNLIKHIFIACGVITMILGVIKLDKKISNNE